MHILRAVHLGVSVYALLTMGCRRLGDHKQEALAGGPPSSSPGPASSSASSAAISTAAPFVTPPVLPGAPDVAALAAAVRPAVVNITVTEETRVSKRPGQLPQLPFDFFFGPQGPFGGGPPSGDQALPRRALGSGFIIDGAGHVVTNAHVVAHAKDVQVKLLDDREFTATVRGRDPRLDVAVLDLQGASGLPTVALGSSEALRVGDYVVAIGNPFGLGDTVTMGIASAKGRSIGAGPYDDFIQTDAAINPGNSGGPLLNLHGQVVGVNTAINPNGQGIGFAIPIDDVKEILPQLLSTGEVKRGRLGVVVQSLDSTTAKAFQLDRRRGALVAQVEPGSAAAKAGFQAGDDIVAVDDTEIKDARDLTRIIARHPPGSKVKVKFLRDRREMTVDATLDELKDETSTEEQEGAPGTSSGKETASLGVNIADTPEGVTVVQVKPGGAAEGVLRTGDVILEVNRKPVHNAKETLRQVAQAPQRQPILLKIRRDDHERFVGVERR
jgi:serine protease Do